MNAEATLEDIMALLKLNAARLTPELLAEAKLLVTSGDYFAAPVYHNGEITIYLSERALALHEKLKALDK